MDFLTNNTFLTIISVVGSVIGLFLALRADLGRRIDRVEEGLGRRIDWVEERVGRVEEGLGQRIDRLEERVGRMEEGLGQRIDRLMERVDRVEEGLGQRIDRLEDRARADHQALVAEIAEVKTAASVLGAKLDERSAPQRLAVQEVPGDYSVNDDPASGPKTP